MKTIKIKNCNECPYHEFVEVDYQFTDYCAYDKRIGKSKTIKDRFTIPDWCPLKEANNDSK